MNPAAEIGVADGYYDSFNSWSEFVFPLPLLNWRILKITSAILTQVLP